MIGLMLLLQSWLALRLLPQFPLHKKTKRRLAHQLLELLVLVGLIGLKPAPKMGAEMKAHVPSVSFQSKQIVLEA